MLCSMHKLLHREFKIVYEVFLFKCAQKLDMQHRHHAMYSFVLCTVKGLWDIFCFPWHLFYQAKLRYCEAEIQLI